MRFVLQFIIFLAFMTDTILSVNKLKMTLYVQYKDNTVIAPNNESIILFKENHTYQLCCYSKPSIILHKIDFEAGGFKSRPEQMNVEKQGYRISCIQTKREFWNKHFQLSRNLNHSDTYGCSLLNNVTSSIYIIYIHFAYPAKFTCDFTALSQFHSHKSSFITFSCSTEKGFPLSDWPVCWLNNEPMSDFVRKTSESAQIVTYSIKNWKNLHNSSVTCSVDQTCKDHSCVKKDVYSQTQTSKLDFKITANSSCDFKPSSPSQIHISCLSEKGFPLPQHNCQWLVNDSSVAVPKLNETHNPANLSVTSNFAFTFAEGLDNVTIQCDVIQENYKTGSFYYTKIKSQASIATASSFHWFYILLIILILLLVIVITICIIALLYDYHKRKSPSTWTSSYTAALAKNEEQEPL